MEHLYFGAYMDPSSSYTIQLVAGAIIVLGALAIAFHKEILAFINQKRYDAMEKKLEKQEQSAIKVSPEGLDE